MVKKTKFLFILIKLLIAAVMIWNLQAAVSLLIDPIGQLPYFLLGGQVGVIVISSIGILFLMWNIPYIFAVLHPTDWKILVPVILTMQLVGLLGEIWIFPLTTGLPPLRETITRFLWFDALGLVFLLVAFILSKQYMES